MNVGRMVSVMMFITALVILVQLAFEVRAINSAIKEQAIKIEKLSEVKPSVHLTPVEPILLSVANERLAPSDREVHLILSKNNLVYYGVGSKLQQKKKKGWWRRK